MSVPDTVELESGTKTKAQLAGDDLIATAQESAQDLWDECYAVTNARGPVMDWQLVGWTYKGKRKERIQLFEISRRCRADGSNGGLEDMVMGDGPFAPFDSMLRNSSGQISDLHKYSIGMLRAVSDPISQIGEMVKASNELRAAVDEERDELVQEIYKGELLKMQADVAKHRWSRIEGMVKATLETVGADMLFLGSMFMETRYGVSELGPMPRDIMGACRELAFTMTLPQLDALGPGEFAEDFLSLLKVCAQADDEATCVAAWDAFRENQQAIVDWAEGISRRQRALLALIRGRVNAHRSAQDTNDRAKGFWDGMGKGQGRGNGNGRPT